MKYFHYWYSEAQDLYLCIPWHKYMFSLSRAVVFQGTMNGDIYKDEPDFYTAWEAQDAQP